LQSEIKKRPARQHRRAFLLLGAEREISQAAVKDRKHELPFGWFLSGKLIPFDF
jgi:hypothetical protein